MNVTIEQVRRIRNHVWLNLVVRYNTNQLTPVEIMEMAEFTINTYNDYYNNNIHPFVRDFLGIQMTLRLINNAFFTMQLERQFREIDRYIRQSFEALEILAQGGSLRDSNLAWRVSGEEDFDLQDTLAGTLTFKIGFIARQNFNLPRISVDERFGYEQFREEEDAYEEERRRREEEEELEEFRRRREWEEEQEAIRKANEQRGRRKEVLRRIGLLSSDLENLQNELLDNQMFINDLRQTRNRFNRVVSSLRQEALNTQRNIRQEITRIERQIRALRLLLNSGVELDETYRPTMSDYSSEDYPNLQDSPFQVPSDIYSRSQSRSQSSSGTFHSISTQPSSTDTEIYSIPSSIASYLSGRNDYDLALNAYFPDLINEFPDVSDLFDFVEQMQASEESRQLSDEINRQRELSEELNRRRELNRIEQESDDLRNEIIDLEIEIQLVRDAINELQSSTRDKRKKYYRTRLSNLNRKLEEYQDRLAECRRQQNRLRRERNQLL